MQNSSESVPEYIKEGANRRIKETLLEQKQSFDLISRKARPMDAEKDESRKIAYIQQQVGVSPAVAKAIGDYANPQSLPLTLEKKNKAESLQGPTVDFMSMCFADLCRAASRSVARVIFLNGTAHGSGFMISPELFITNNHVIKSAAEANDIHVEFNYEADFRNNLLGSTQFKLDPERFFFTAPEDDLDFTVVAVGERFSGSLSLSQIGYLPLLDSDDRHMMNIFVNCIQHPGGKTKQLVIRENRLLARTPTTLIYGSDTEPGSSGSPLFNDAWEVVALHHWGEPYRSLVEKPEGLPKNGNEGIRISAIVKNLQRQTDFKPAQQILLQKALNHHFRAPSLMNNSPLPVAFDNNINSTTQSNAENTPTNIANESVYSSQSFTIPLTISVQLGKALNADEIPVTESTIATSAGAEAVKKFIPDPNYTNRRGYNPSFLGQEVLLPKLSDSQKLIAARNQQAGSGNDPFELKYEHFSLVMNGERRIAFFTAANIDGASVITIKRETGEVTRGPEVLGAEGAESGREKWYDDDRIDDAQISEDEIYKKKLTNFQRGHLVKRTDPSWGTATKAFKGQADTFHFTNCSPQHKNFNPNTSRWAGVENWITKTSNDVDIRVSVFSGPVFSDDDPKVDYLQIPKAFWKVVVWVEGGKLLATAIVADQSDLIADLPDSIGQESLFDDIPDKLPEDYHVTITEIERLTGLDFGSLKDNDILSNGSEALGGPAVNDTPRKRIYAFSDITKRGLTDS